MTKYEIKLEDVMTYKNYFAALKQCNRNVNYKFSVQEYNRACVENIVDTIRLIYDDKVPMVKNVRPVIITERGKRRVITPIDIRDRITQKVLCDQVLVPSICPHLIHDNEASMKEKGTEFARNRVDRFIEDAKRKYGAENLYALVFDFKGYFDSIRHDQCYRVLKKYIFDERLVDLVMGIIESYKYSDICKLDDIDRINSEIEKLHNHEYVGICLGSQISQIMAVAVPNDFDHFIKDKLRVKYYERYMDDGIIIDNNKERLVRLIDILSKEAEKYGLQFNMKKTHVTKLTHGFVFLKVKYSVDKNGKTVKRLVPSGIVRERRKLKKFHCKVEAGEMTLDDVYNNIQSWLAHSKIAKCYRTQKSMLNLYDDLYDGYKITRRYYRKHPEEAVRKRKVVRQ